MRSDEQRGNHNVKALNISLAFVRTRSPTVCDFQDDHEWGTLHSAQLHGAPFTSASLRTPLDRTEQGG